MSRKRVPFNEIEGIVFGTLRIVSEASDYPCSSRYVNVICERCGETSRKIFTNILRSVRNGTTGCKCKPSRNEGQFAYKHGLSGHPAYGTWDGMIRRCYSSDHEAYHRYGGRGIFVCEEWRESPIEFISWLERNDWRPGLEVDRRDNDDGYHPGNCRIVTSKINCNNTSRNVFLEVDGEKISLRQASVFYGISKSTISQRLKSGWSHNDAVKTPPLHVQTRYKRETAFTLDVNGERMTIAEICTKFKIDRGTLQWRIKRGWSEHDIVFKPVRPKQSVCR